MTSPTSPFVDPRAQEKVVKYDGGEITVLARPLTRAIKNEALRVAADKYEKETGRLGFWNDDLERELAVRLIERWSLPLPPAIGWTLFNPDTDAPHKLREALDIDKVFELFAGKGKEVDAAKNE